MNAVRMGVDDGAGATVGRDSSSEDESRKRGASRADAVSVALQAMSMATSELVSTQQPLLPSPNSTLTT